MKGYRFVNCESLGRVVSEACVSSVCTSPLVVMEDLADKGFSVDLEDLLH